MTSHRDEPDHTAPANDPPSASATAPSNVPAHPSDHHRTALGRHLDTYLAGVARELQANGVLTGAPQRSNPAHRLIGSIVLDCTALRLAAWTPEDPISGARSLGHAIQPEHPAPVLASWDEDKGWCVGLHHDPAHSSRRYLHPDPLPAPQAVADFVVGLALGQALGVPDPITPAGPVRPRLRLLP